VRFVADTVILLDLVTEVVPVELRDIDTLLLRVGLIDRVRGGVVGIAVLLMVLVPDSVKG
jgi:hypothetical protein